MAKLAGTLPVTDLLTLTRRPTAALLWALVRDRLRDGAGPADAVAGTVAEVERAAPGLPAQPAAHRRRLDRRHRRRARPLRTRRDGGAVLVSSEPLDDDPAWRPVPDRTLLVATAAGLTLTPLGRA